MQRRRRFDNLAETANAVASTAWCIEGGRACSPTAAVSATRCWPPRPIDRTRSHARFGRRGDVNIGGGTTNLGALLQTTSANDGFGDVVSQQQDYRLSGESDPLHPYQLHQSFVPAIALPMSLQPPAEDFDGASRPNSAGLYLYGAYNR